MMFLVRPAFAILLVLCPLAASAAAVKGTVVLPEAERSGRRYSGYWRIENGNVPVQGGGKTDSAVVVVVAKGQSPAAKTTTVDLAGLAAQPPVVVVGSGSVVEFKNSDRVAHELYTVGQSSFMPVERTEPGGLRRQKFSATGGYLVRDAEYPHIAISVVVVDNPFFAVADDRGGFSIGGVPEGKATLKVWSRGRWVHERSIEPGNHTSDLSIKLAPSTAKEAAE